MSILQKAECWTLLLATLCPQMLYIIAFYANLAKKKWVSYFSQKIGSDVSYKSLFSRQNKKYISNCRPLKFVPSMQSVKWFRWWRLLSSCNAWLYSCRHSTEIQIQIQRYNALKCLQRVSFGVLSVRWPVWGLLQYFTYWSNTFQKFPESETLVADDPFWSPWFHVISCNLSKVV